MDLNAIEYDENLKFSAAILKMYNSVMDSFGIGVDRYIQAMLPALVDAMSYCVATVIQVKERVTCY